MIASTSCPSQRLKGRESYDSSRLFWPQCPELSSSIVQLFRYYVTSLKRCFFIEALVFFSFAGALVCLRPRKSPSMGKHAFLLCGFQRTGFKKSTIETTATRWKCIGDRVRLFIRSFISFFHCVIVWSTCGRGDSCIEWVFEKLNRIRHEHIWKIGEMFSLSVVFP